MKILVVLLFVFLSVTASAQYYYKDIIGTKETTEMMKTYLANKVNRVKVNSYDGEGEKSDAVFIEQYFSPAERKLTTITRTDSSDESQLISFVNEAGEVYRTIDSNSSIKTITDYRYNSAGFPEKILMVTTESQMNTQEKEEHIWFYSDGKPSKMLRIKNDIDTTKVDFKTDENGNIGEELSTGKGVRSEPVYYFYDNKNRLTDIVRYNTKAKRLLPEYMFEYSPSNQVIQRITVPANGSKYLIWRYQYDERGLKIKEAVYDRYKQLNGKVEYLYSFGR